MRDLRITLAAARDLAVQKHLAMDTTGRPVTGSLQGSGFTGQPFVLAK